MISAIEKMAEKSVRPILTYADECHHAAANTAVEVLQKVNARYVYGVSATIKRSDELEKMIPMLIGPMRHSYTA
jgi:superfamily II DNA or RNA helicase